MLSSEELQRYSRHLILPEFGMPGQLRLKESSVLVVGAGGLGCPILQTLTAAGVGCIGIVDDDDVSFSNLQRQFLYGESDIGQSKVLVAIEKLGKNNSDVDFKPYIERLSSDNVDEIIENYDLVIDGSDNFPTRYLVNDACVIHNKPLVFGSLFKFEGQVSVLNYENGPTYRCLFPKPPSPEKVPNCAQIGVLGALPAIIGNIMATEAIKVLAGIGEVLSGRLLLYNALSMSFRFVKFERSGVEVRNYTDYDEFCGITEERSVAEVEPSEVASSDDFVLLDIRPKVEKDIADIGGLWIPRAELLENLAAIPRDKKVAVYCHFGTQSASVISELEGEFGFHNLHNLSGGIEKWSTTVDPEIPRY